MKTINKINNIAVRVYSKRKEDKIFTKKISEIEDLSKVLVLDTETTIDQFQNLTFGSFRIYNNELVEQQGIIYNPEIVKEKELQILVEYKLQHNLGLYAKEEFVNEILYPNLLAKVPIIAYNLPFDLSRLMIRSSYCKGDRFKGGFSLQLSENTKFPRIRIKHLDSTKSFIELGSIFNDEIFNDEKKFKGYFIDVKTLVFALSNKDMSLANATTHFNLDVKKYSREKHGIITPKYIEYNLNDTAVTYKLFKKLLEEIKKFNIDTPISKIYSSASIGKAFLDNLGIKSFMQQNPNFPPKVMGYLMSAFYGGRCELRIRKKPVHITLLDFFSTYPTLFTLMGYWEYLTAEHIQYYEDTEMVQKLLEKIESKDLLEKDIWKKLSCIVEIQPDEDILPIRVKYDGKTYNIALNYVTSEKHLFYTLADIIASKLLTGKTPRIVRAIRFEPIGKQNSLKDTEILGIKINPKEENLIKYLAEKRYELKKNNKISEVQSIKVLLNSICYGIFIQMDEHENHEELEIYSNEKFTIIDKPYEKIGAYYNPIIAVNLVAGARLLLAISEQLLQKYKVVPPYMDTDSMAVPVVLADKIVEYFKPLNPYSFDSSIFKKDKEKKWFYGICSKRYVLFDKKGNEIIIGDKDYKLHGLGYIKNPLGSNESWAKTLWKDALNIHYKIDTIENVMDKYNNSYAVSQLSISSYDTHKRFKKLNHKQPVIRQIKPFSFMLIGVSNNKDIKPIAPYSHNTQKAVHEEFIDYNSCKTMKGQEYWKQLNNIFNDFINKKEHKFDGEEGELKRKHIRVESITYIGKEAKNIETTGTIHGTENNTYEKQEDIINKLRNMTVAEAKQKGISKTTLFCIKERIKQGKEIKLKKKTIQRLYY